MFGIETGIFILLALAVLAACFFEFINGFHDTANAVATVIYTHSLKPIHAVIFSGALNFLGVLMGGIGVGLSIIHLLPIELILNQSDYQSLAMIFSILITAILWNFGTWYYGIPSSSSHTLIGAIIGIGIGFAVLPENTEGIAAINWAKVKTVFTGLLMAPVIGFGLAIILMKLIEKFAPKASRKQLFDEPDAKKGPPTWIKSLLIATCGLVSFAHGNNDGQKGIGLVMLILISCLPTLYAINTQTNFDEFHKEIVQAKSSFMEIDSQSLTEKELGELAKIRADLDYLSKAESFENKNKLEIRKKIIDLSNHSKSLLTRSTPVFSTSTQNNLKELLITEESGIRKAIDFSPIWIKLMISLSLGFGTMVGWKRIVVTVGEKIGKTHLTYAQGASAELVAASTVGLASGFGLPVSTTHTLSSGIAGSMVADKGIKNLNYNTIRNIALTWVLTFPVSMILSASLFLLSRWLIQ